MQKESRHNLHYYHRNSPTDLEVKNKYFLDSTILNTAPSPQQCSVKSKRLGTMPLELCRCKEQDFFAKMCEQKMKQDE